MRWTLRAARNTLVAAFLAFMPGRAAGQPMAISHDSLDCWPSDLYPILSGALSPPDDVRSVRIYFRSEVYPDFYFVDATVQPDGHLEAVLPLAAPDTRRVIYYIEAVNRFFETARTQEWNPEVSESEECRRRDPLLALFQGKIPDIVVGAVRAGAPALPPGFMSAGIVAAGTGGIGATAIVGIVAGGVAGGVVVANGGSEETSSATTSVFASPSPTSIPGGSTTSVPASTTTTALSSPTSTTTSPPTTTIGPTTTSAPGSSTTTTTGISTTTTSGISTTTTTSAPSTTTSPPTTTTSAPATTTSSAPPAADMAIAISAPGSVALGKEIHYLVDVSNKGPSPASGVRATIQFPSLVIVTNSGPCSSFLSSAVCNLGAMAAGESKTIKITVLTLQLGTVTANASVKANEPDPAPGNNTASATTTVTLLLRDSPKGFVRLAVHLDVPPSDGRDRGDVFVGSRLTGVDDTAPVELAVNSEPGEYLVEAVVTSSTGRRGRWRFELRLSPEIEAAGIQVEAGEVISSEPRAVSFHVRGEAGERLRFRYRLTAREPG